MPATQTGPDPNPLRVMCAGVDWIARSSTRAFLLIFLLALGLRTIVLLNWIPAEYVRPHTRSEQQAIAVSLATHGEFANPYALPTGPTAHLPPIWPAVIGLIYRVFGLTSTAGYIGWMLGIATFSAIYGLLPWLSGTFGLGREAGVLGGITGAFIWEWPGHGEAATAIAMGLLLLAVRGRWRAGNPSMGSSFLFGVAWGIAFHLRPALLPVMLGCIAFELWWSTGARKWVSVAVVTAGVVFACVPWGVRNYVAFQEVFFVRSNFGLELRMAYHEGAAAAMEVMDARQEHRHPRTHEGEAIAVQEWGEIEYMRRARLEATDWIWNHPGESLRLTASRFLHVWFGPLHRPITAVAVTGLTVLALLGAWRTLAPLAVPERAVLLIPLATYPLIFYPVTYMPRYRIPLNWILLMFGGAAVWHWVCRSSRRGAVDYLDAPAH